MIGITEKAKNTIEKHIPEIKNGMPLEEVFDLIAAKLNELAGEIEYEPETELEQPDNYDETKSKSYINWINSGGLA